MTTKQEPPTMTAEEFRKQQAEKYLQMTPEQRAKKKAALEALAKLTPEQRKALLEQIKTERQSLL